MNPANTGELNPRTLTIRKFFRDKAAVAGLVFIVLLCAQFVKTSEMLRNVA